MRKIRAAVLMAVFGLPAFAQGAENWSWRSRGYVLSWDLQHDTARLVSAAGAEAWRGPLLPGFWLQLPGGERRFVKAELDPSSAMPAATGGKLSLVLPGVGRGALEFSAEPWGIRFRELRVMWDAAPPALIGLYFGAAALTGEQKSIVPSLELPFWPAWNAEGYAVPSGKGAPVQSFFRNWDMGHATFPLGSFGPSLGTPYAAAFPKPVLSAAMGGGSGWLVFGPGAIPDGALTFEVRAATAMLHLLYREDLWGGPNERVRVWQEPLRLAWAPEAWDAFHELFASFGPARPAAQIHQKSHWNTWGNFKEQYYDLRFLADRAPQFGAEALVIDEGWESFDGSGTPNRQRFPAFDADLQYIRDKGLALGFWLPIGWVADPDAVGLRREDLLVGKDGTPRRAAWNMSVESLGSASFCLDPSSAHAREYLRNRSLRIMRDYHPQVLKLDFGYGLPGPDVAAPRNPAFRGERMALELMKIIADASREVNPDVTIQYNGIHPLMRSVTDAVALDDLGDAGGFEAEAHAEWSIWAALAASNGAAILSSSGYDWKADSDILLDSAAIGAPGSVLPLPRPGQPEIPAERIAHRQAIARWHRRSTLWRPLWLDSEKGAIGREPRLRSFGRIEQINGAGEITALALRPARVPFAELRGMRWEGRWAVIAQDDAGIFASKKLACVPFDTGFLEIPMAAAPASVTVLRGSQEKPFHDWRYSGGMLRLPGGAPGGYLIRLPERP